MKNIAWLTALLWTISLPLAAEPPHTTGPAERALMDAALSGRLGDVQRLLSEGAAVDATDDEKRTPLMFASFNGHISVAEYLHDKGAELDAKDSNGRTALIYASSGPFPETVEFLLKEGAEVDVRDSAEGFTALMTAAAEGQLEVVRILLVYGATRAIKDTDGDTAESFARRNGHSAVVDLLVNPPSR